MNFLIYTILIPFLYHAIKCLLQIDCKEIKVHSINRVDFPSIIKLDIFFSNYWSIKMFFNILEIKRKTNFLYMFGEWNSTFFATKEWFAISSASLTWNLCWLFWSDYYYYYEIRGRLHSEFYVQYYWSGVLPETHRDEWNS